MSSFETVAQRPSATTEHGAGVYLHVPFCRHRCGYCDFNVATGWEVAGMRRYVEGVRAELARLAAAGPRAVAPPGADVDADWPVFTSVFVGGGTPTQLPATELAGLLACAREVLPVAEDAEVSVEANPEDLDVAYLAELVAAGLTRLSVGVQSFTPEVLTFLDRRHDPETPLRAVAAARGAGVASVNLDLIYGAPAETPPDWEVTLDAAVAADPDHVSAYALTLEQGTVYAARVRAGAQAAPDEDVQAERMAVADDRLAVGGYARYETSNWARPGHACRHNLTYWRGGDWLGAGAGAHGHWAGRRWWNVRPTARYTELALAGGDTVSGEETLDEAQRRAERLLLGLRLVEGVERAAVEPLDEDAVARLAERGLLTADADRLRLTAAGRPLADAVTLRLLP